MLKLSQKKGLWTEIMNTIKMMIMKFQNPELDFEKDPVPTETEIDWTHNKGIKYWNRKKYRKAIEMFQREIAMDKRDYFGHWCLGQIYAELGHKKEAREYYEVALQNAKKRYEEYPEGMDEEIIQEITEDIKSMKKGN